MGENGCEACARRPSGLEGHEDIETHAVRDGDGRQLFRCRACGRLWVRNYEGSGVFVWVDAGTDSGG